MSFLPAPLLAPGLVLALWPQEIQSWSFSATPRNSSAFLAKPFVMLVHTDSLKSAGSRFFTEAIASGADLAIPTIVGHRFGSGRDCASVMKCRGYC